MSRYPGEKSLVREILSAYRSTIKYMQDPILYLENTYQVLTSISKRRTGDYITFMRKTIPDLRNVHNQLMKDYANYDSSYIEGCIRTMQTIINNPGLQGQDLSSSINGCALQIYLLLRNLDKTGVNHPQFRF